MQTSTFTLSLAVCLVSFIPLHSQTPTHAPEQTTFTDSDSVKAPVAVPPAVANLILEDPALQKLASLQKDKTADELFAGPEIHLGPANEIHLVVIGVCPVCGGDNDWFWIIRSPYKSPKTIGGGGGSGFAFLTTKTQGYRDLESDWSSAAGFWKKDVYRFKGSEYKLWRHSEGQYPNPCQ